jgi:hypothetical protein
MADSNRTEEKLSQVLILLVVLLPGGLVKRVLCLTRLRSPRKSSNSELPPKLRVIKDQFQKESEGLL